MGSAIWKAYVPLSVVALNSSKDFLNYLYKHYELIEQYKIKRNITEELKEKNQMKWVQEMNDIENVVMEFIKENYIH